MASMPLLATCKRMDGLVSRKPSIISRTSPGLSSTSRTCRGVSLPCMRTSRSSHGFRLAPGQGKTEGGTLAGLGFERDAAAVPCDDLLADGQSDAGAGKLFPFVQPLEHAKNLFEVLRINPQSVVPHREDPFLPATTGSGNMHPGNSGALILDGIADQVLKYLDQLGFVRHHFGEGIVGHQG